MDQSLSTSTSSSSEKILQLKYMVNRTLFLIRAQVHVLRLIQLRVAVCTFINTYQDAMLCTYSLLVPSSAGDKQLHPCQYNALPPNTKFLSTSLE